MSELKYVFISHSNKEPDASLLMRLDEYLTSLKLCSWFDVEGLRGDKWTVQIANRIRNATVYVLIASENSLVSPEVKFELDKIRFEKLDYKKVIIPFVIMDADKYFTMIRDDDDLNSTISKSDQAVIMSKFATEQDAFERLGDYLTDYLDEFTNNPKDFVTDETHTRLKKYIGSDSIVRIPAEITEIGEFAFSGNKQLQKVIIPPSVTKLERYAFGSCDNLVSVEGMQGVELCDATAFSGAQVTCDKSNGYSICGVVFDGDVVNGVLTIPDGTRVIASNAFSCSEAEQIVFPEGLCHIGVKAFEACANIKEVVFPSSLTTIGKKAFADCFELETAIFTGVKPTDAELAFDKINIKELSK